MLLVNADGEVQEFVLRTGFQGINDIASRAAGLDNFGESRAVQSQKDEADINVLVKRFGIGEDSYWPQKVRVPLPEDFLELFDFQGAQNAIIQAGNSFRALPASIRARFGNDPGEFVDFCLDKENIDEMRKLGLAIPAAAGSVDGSGAAAAAAASGGAPG